MSRIAEALDRTVYRDGLPGRKEETTSFEAAKIITTSAATLRAAVLRSIQEAPRTADEVAAALDQTVLAVRPRCSELRGAGKIRPLIDGRGRQVRRKNESGINAIVWQSTREGA